MPVTHAYQSATANNPSKEISSDRWNEAHTVSISNADVAADAAIAQSKLNIANAATGVTGLLTGADWDTFSGKQAALTLPLGADLGGTGIANAAGSTLTLGAATAITGGGTVALGGFTLTVPATGTAALLGTANVFTTTQTITPGTDVAGLVINKPTTANALEVKNGATVIAGIDKDGDVLIGEYVDTVIPTLHTPSITNAGINIQVAGGLTFLNFIAAGGRKLSLGASNSECYSNLIPNGSASYSLGNEGNRWTYIHASALRITPRRTEIQLVVYGHTVQANPVAHIYTNDTTNNDTREALRLESRNSTASTGGAAGFGVGQSFFAETATDGTYQQQGLISTSWIDATNATRKAKMSLSAYDTAARLGLEIEADGSAAKIGFLGATPIVRQAHIVDADGTLADVTSKFNSLLAYLENFGFIATT